MLPCIARYPKYTSNYLFQCVNTNLADLAATVAHEIDFHPFGRFINLPLSPLALEPVSRLRFSLV